MKNLQDLRNMNNEGFAEYLVENVEYYGVEDGLYFEIELEEGKTDFLIRFDNDDIVEYLKDKGYIDADRKLSSEEICDKYAEHEEEIDKHFIADLKELTIEELEEKLEK